LAADGEDEKAGDIGTSQVSAKDTDSQRWGNMPGRRNEQRNSGEQGGQRGVEQRKAAKCRTGGRGGERDSADGNRRSGR